MFLCVSIGKEFIIIIFLCYQSLQNAYASDNYVCQLYINRGQFINCGIQTTLSVLQEISMNKIYII